MMVNGDRSCDLHPMAYWVNSDVLHDCDEMTLEKYGISKLYFRDFCLLLTMKLI